MVAGDLERSLPDPPTFLRAWRRSCARRWTSSSGMGPPTTSSTRYSTHCSSKIRPVASTRIGAGASPAGSPAAASSTITCSGTTPASPSGSTCTGATRGTAGSPRAPTRCLLASLRRHKSRPPAPGVRRRAFGDLRTSTSRLRSIRLPIAHHSQDPPELLFPLPF